MYGAGAASVVTVYAGSSSAHVCHGPVGISVIVAKLWLLSLNLGEKPPQLLDVLGPGH